jgi:hypothetical protein
MLVFASTIKKIGPRKLLAGEQSKSKGYLGKMAVKFAQGVLFPLSESFESW